jgi:hypothetical protein
LAATLVAVAVRQTDAVVLHVGDGAVALRIGGGWLVPSWPMRGEYASSTYFVTDADGPRARWERIPGRVERVVAFTDGMERLALDFTDERPFSPFLDAMTLPLHEGAEGRGLDRHLSALLRKFLDSEAVTLRTDDDKTLVLAVR